MLSIERALWYIELELESQLDLGCVARHCNMSPFALARLFALSTGWSVMRYVRARRLSQAALTLRRGAPDILQVALDAGYGSHEAFTRAFCDLFGFTPKQVRGHEDEHLSLVEPLRMKERKLITLSEPRFETRAEFFIAGLGDRFTFDKNEGIVGLWQAFSPYLGQVPNQVNNGSYGLCCNPELDGSFEYIASTEVSCVEGLPPAFRYFRVPQQNYVVFRHQGHISTIHQTFFTIFNHWLPESEYELADAPEFEQYSPDFEPSRGKGYVDVWIPLARRQTSHAINV
ncbi:transcriptional regulator, AraC family [Pseudomonas sp. 43mfcvi1.1]|jgi:AraC family transcriptional regulator|uniref:AraC family transcriptional regulator n=1 Tax=Pseudomonas sp. 43mfcvi1.1 TaxID=1761894 RepID=UPI000D6B8394|nr:AraC family transcriptional regulator [Pseudomonas sp. 43mfcvi1.1]PWJ33792.1 AraC family transcriptional regulator [Pseudomonas sp. 43mfcvi1.1]SSB97766.1 transcriptional regulator, AraC family [Pseudomonas sp. 43mfcvi1.1]